jgi:hypothetical protein
MRLVRTAMAAALGGCAMAGAAPASAQFYLQSKDYAGQPVRGDEPGILSVPMPDATEAERRAALAWTLRAALNVAALQCQFEPTLNTVRNYNAMILDHKDELQKSFDLVGAYFKRTAATPKAGQAAFDSFNTKTYSGFATVAAQLNFCQTANAIGLDSNFAPRGHFGEFAQERMQELRNSLTPHGEQRVPHLVARYMTVSAPAPRLDKICWNKKGDWQTKKCGVLTWPPSGVATAAR